MNVLPGLQLARTQDGDELLLPFRTQLNQLALRTCQLCCRAGDLRGIILADRGLQSYFCLEVGQPRVSKVLTAAGPHLLELLPLRIGQLQLPENPSPMVMMPTASTFLNAGPGPGGSRRGRIGGLRLK
jgi:hypothetical protein